VSESLEIEACGLNIKMDIDPSRIENVRKETTSELLRWKSQYKPSSPLHIAANVELVRRDDQMKSRLWTAVTIVAMSLIVGAAFWLI
jgi:hypothetical protein